jgi:ribonuclease HII
MADQSLKQIKDELSKLELQELKSTIEIYKQDQRAGVKKLIEHYEKEIEKHTMELERIKSISQYEQQQYAKGKNYIAGIDEVGRGPLAGPVVTSCVILPKDCLIMGINDSKKLSQLKREELYIKIQQQAIAITIGIVDVDTIDNINILQATYKAMQQAIEKLSQKPDILLVDAVTIPDIDVEQLGIIKGDAKSITIGAASIIAKVTRDRMMDDYHELFPEYGFDKNKGYGTAEHIEAIKKYGLCPIHRRTFVKNFIEA